MNPEPLRYPGLTLSIFSGAFVFGIVISSLGALLPELFLRIGFEKAAAGGLFLGMNFAMLLSSLVFGPICDRFGYRFLLLASCLAVAFAFFLLSRSTAFGEILSALLLLGLGGGALNGATNALINDINPENRERALNRLGIFFGLGALMMPFLIGTFLSRTGLQPILIVMIGLALAAFILFVLAQFPRPKHEQGFSWDLCASVLRDPRLFLFAAILFFQSGNELTIGGWTSTYLEERFRMGPRNAAYVLSGYWAAILVGRIVVSRIGKRIEAPTLVGWSALVALVGSVGMIYAPNGPLAAAFIGLVGLGFAAIFPTILAQAGSVFASLSATTFSILFVTALVGGMTTPWLVGRIAQSSSLTTGLRVSIAYCAGIGILQWVIRRRWGRAL